MKIISWNCNRAFRNKYKKVLKYNADIYIISEAERPEKYTHQSKYKEYLDIISNHYWIGSYKDGKLYEDKGLLIFAKKDIALKNNFWNSKHELFLSINVNNYFDLVGVWTQNNTKLNSYYVEEMIAYLRIFEEKIKKSGKIIFCGDFNSNKIWDKNNGKGHMDMVKLFNSMNLKSIYHELSQEEEGKESVPTFYQYFHKDKPYHIDYVFSTPNLVKTLSIGSYEEFVGCENMKSDHVPLIFEIKL